MSVAELLAELRRRDAYIGLDDGRLRLNAPVGALPERLRRELLEHKAEIVAFLDAAQRLADQQRAIVPLQPRGERAPIFAVAGHNGDVFCYRALAQQVGADQPLFGLQPPGLDEGSEPLASIEGLAGYFADQIQEFRPEGPLAIAGFCAGGTVAFELARQLSASGRDVTRLVLFGAPYCASYRLLPRVGAGCGALLARMNAHSRALAGLRLGAWRHYLAGRLRARRAAAATAAADPVMARRAVVERATVAAIRRYTPGAFNGHLDMMLPSEADRRSTDTPLRWLRHAATSAVFVGPEDCTGDTMLLPGHAAVFASFLEIAFSRNPATSLRLTVSRQEVSA